MSERHWDVKGQTLPSLGPKAGPRGSLTRGSSQAQKHRHLKLSGDVFTPSLAHIVSLSVIYTVPPDRATREPFTC